MAFGVGRTDDEAEEASSRMKVKAVAACLGVCASQCKASLLDLTMVQGLWALSSTLRCCDLIPNAHAADMSKLESFDWVPCTQLVNCLLDLLNVMLPILDTAFSSSSGNSSTGDSGNSKPTSGKGTHSQTAAASRAAHVLQQRRLKAAQGLVSVLHLSALASAVQVLTTLFKFLAQHNTTRYGSGKPRPNCTSRIAESLFEGGRVAQSLHIVSSILLRCVRRRHLPQQLQQPAVDDVFSTLEFQRDVACKHACHAAVNMFGAATALNEASMLNVVKRLHPHYFATLACLACEGLRSDDGAAWHVASLLKDSSLLKLLEIKDKEASDLRFKMVHCSAMQHLSRRVSPTAIARGESLNTVLNLLKGFHPVIEWDTLMSVQFRISMLWPAPPYWEHSAFQADSFPAQGRGGNENEGAYFLPCTRDSSLLDFIKQLPSYARATRSDSGALLSATLPSSLIAHITAVLLSLQHPHAASAASASASAGACGKSGNGALSPSELYDVLQVVAGIASALAIRLLNSQRMGHAECPHPVHEDPDLVGYCVHCSILAESITALMLQLLRLFTGPRGLPRPTYSKGEPSRIYINIVIYRHIYICGRIYMYMNLYMYIHVLVGL